MNKKILYLIPIILLVFGGIYFVGAKNRPSTTNQTPTVSIPTPESKTTINLDFGDGQIIKADAVAGKSAFEVLKEIAESNQIKIETKQYDFGVFVQAIGNKENTKELAWIYFVNGKSGEVAADKYVLKPGDSLEWKYVAPIY